MDALEQVKRRISWTGVLEDDARVLLFAFDRADIWQHVEAVALKAQGLAQRFGVSEADARAAALLHDIAWIWPPAQMLEVARDLHIEVLEAEEYLPMLLHQKLGAKMSCELFGVSPVVSQAILCHTTLKAGPAPLEQIVFLADKLAPFEGGSPAYLPTLEAAVTRSLEDGTLVFLEHLWAVRSSLAAVHPWLEEAWLENRKAMELALEPS